MATNTPWALPSFGPQLTPDPYLIRLMSAQKPFRILHSSGRFGARVPKVGRLVARVTRADKGCVTKGRSFWSGFSGLAR